MTTQLSPQRYFELIDSDTDRLVAMGQRGLKAAVPGCPGWDVGEVVWHVATVYEHKIRVMADNAFPEAWPPTWDFRDDEEIAFLQSAKARLFEEFARHEIGEQTQTFGADTTIAFWARRMACEIAIHRYDGEQAHDDTTPIPADIAIDGIDEMLHVMLAGPWWKERVQTDHPVDALVAIEAGGHRWVCDVQRASVTVTPDAPAPAVAMIVGDPEAVFLWMWGRVGDDAVAFSGDQTIALEFRDRLAECAA